MTNVLRGETEEETQTHRGEAMGRQMWPLAEGQRQPPGAGEAGTALPLRRPSGPALILNA